MSRNWWPMDCKSYLCLPFLILLLGTFPQIGCAKDVVQPTISGAWFKPSLSTNNDSSVCEPLLNGYINSFQSRLDDPLPGNIYGTRKQTPSISLVTKALREIAWKEVYVGNTVLRMARFQVAGHRYSLVRRDYSIGWREGFHNDILITKPFSAYAIDEKDYPNFFDENDLGVFLNPEKSDDFRPIYKNDKEWKNQQKRRVYANLENIYQKGGVTYLLFSQQNGYLLLRMIDDRRLLLTCDIKTTPSKAQIEEQLATMPVLLALKNALFAMMGTECNGGTLHALSNASNGLMSAFYRMTYRPWILKGEEDRRRRIESNLDQWGHGGIWEFMTFKTYRSNLLKAEGELAKFYESNFLLPNVKARQMAHSAMSQALIDGFDHGRFSDVNHVLHKRILNGTVSAEDLADVGLAVLAKDGDEPWTEQDESLLTFAVAQPQALRMLLKKGANANHQNWFGKTPLMYAAQFDQLGSSKILLAHGARTETYTVKTTLSCINTNHLTALHYAVRYASVGVIRLLLQHGAPTFARDSNGNTPLDYLDKYENKKLASAERDELKVTLLPIDDQQQRILSKRENQRAERLYAEKKLQDAYLSLKKALMLDPLNESALSNLSLIALRLDRLGESAAASSLVVKTTSSVDLRANALFNLGLACRKTKSGTIDFDGNSYCRVGAYASGGKKTDEGMLASFLASYRLKPTSDRLNAILSVFQDSAIDNRNSRCSFGNTLPGVREVHFNSLNWYFLTDASVAVPFSQLSGSFSNGVQPFFARAKETIPLTDTRKIERWEMEQGYYVPTYMDNMICAPTLLKAFERDTKVVAVFPSSNSENSRPIGSGLVQHPRKKVAIHLTNTTPVILFLYGHNTEFLIDGEMPNTRGIYMYGNSTVTLPKDSEIQVVRFAEKDSLSSFVDFPNAMNARMIYWIGLPMSSMINIGDADRATLSEDAIIKSRWPN